MYRKQLLYEQNMEYPVLVVISTHAVVAIVVIIIQCVLCVCVLNFFCIFWWSVKMSDWITRIRNGIEIWRRCTRTKHIGEMRSNEDFRLDAF